MAFWLFWRRPEGGRQRPRAARGGRPVGRPLPPWGPRAWGGPWPRPGATGAPLEAARRIPVHCQITVKISISVCKLGLPRALRKALRRLHAPSKASRRAQRHRQEVDPRTFSQYRYFALFSPACWPVAARWSFHWGGEQLLPTIRDPEPMSPTRTPRRRHCKHRELHCRPC